MLYDEPILQFRGLTIFKDFSDPRTYYYLPPEAPRIARSAENAGANGEGGDYAMRLVLWRADPNAPQPPGMEEGGGFLNLDTDLRVPEALRKAAEDEVRNRFGTDANLVPVPFTEGSVELVLLGATRDDAAGGAGAPQQFVRKVAGSTVPSLYGTQRAAFSTVLDRNGAALMRSVIEAGGATMALAIYHLTYAGIGPAYNLKITIDYERVYEHLDLRLNASVSAGNSKNKLVAKAGFHMLMEELKEKRAIKVEEVDPIPGENGRTPTNQEAINQIIANLMGSTWFKPTLASAATTAALTAPTGGTTPSPSPSTSPAPTPGPTPSPGPAPAGANATTPTPPAGSTPTPPAGTPPAAGPTPPASGPATAPTPQPSPPPAPARQAAVWTEDARPAGFPTDRGVEPFAPSASGDSETLTVRGDGATATVDGQPVAITGGRLVVPGVSAGSAAKQVVIRWPATPEQTDDFHVFFQFAKPANNNEVNTWAQNAPASDTRFHGSSQSRAASGAPGGIASLGPWLASLGSTDLRIVAYASNELDARDGPLNRALAERRAQVAAGLIAARGGGRPFNIVERRGIGYDPDTTGASGPDSLQEIPGNGTAPDGHGASSLPAHRVALIKGLVRAGRPASELRGNLSRAGSTAPPVVPPPHIEPPPPVPPKKEEKKDEDPMKLEASFEVNFEMIERQERITASYELSSRKARRQQVHPQGQLMLDAIDPKRYVLEADLAIDFFQKLAIAASTTAGWAEDGIHSIQVQLRYAPGAEPGSFQRSGEIVLNPQQPTGSWTTGVLRDGADPDGPVRYDYQYKVTVHYTPDVALGNQQGAVTSQGLPRADAEGWIASDARNLVIHPRDVTPAVTVNVSTGVMQFDLLNKVQLVLTYGPYRQNIELSPDHKDHRIVIRPDPELAGAALQTSGTLFYRDGAQVPLPLQSWQPQELVVVNEPRENLLRVRTILADPAGEYERVMVTLRYADGNRLVDESFELKAHAESRDWSVRLEDPAARAWRYEATLVKKSGDIDHLDWRDGSDELLVLGVRAVDVIPVQVNWLLVPPAGELLAVKIDLLYEDPANDLRWTRSELIRPGHTGSFDWAVPIRDPARRGYRYRVTEFPAAGAPREGAWIDASDQMLVLVPGG